MWQIYRNQVVLLLIMMLLMVACGEDEGQVLEAVVDLSEKTEGAVEEIEVDDGQNLSQTVVHEDSGLVEGQKEERLINQVAEMSIEDKVGQLFFLDLQSYENTTIPAGGLIFFRHDLTTWEDTVQKIQDFQQASQIPLFISIDEEGGIVTRITGDESIGGTVVDSSWNLAHSNVPGMVYQGSATIASELESLGFNMNFAPVADVNSNPNNPIIGKRAFSDDPELTGQYVVEALSAYKDFDVVPVVKHFPGHGNTQGDSHSDLVYIKGDMDYLLANELVPFIEAIEAGVQVIMMGHIILEDVPALEGQVASMNRGVIQGILVDTLGYEGLVISDSLIMGSISNHMTVEEVIDQGLYAGLDLFLMPETPQIAYDYLLEQAKESDEVLARVEASVLKILALKETMY